MKIVRFTIEIEVPAAARMTKKELEPFIKTALKGVEVCQFQITQKISPNTRIGNEQ